MTIEYDEKGKFYTEVVTKIPAAVVIQTTAHLIRGLVHIRKGERLKSELEWDEKFLAVTQATIHDANDHVLFTAPFLAILRDQIVWIMPMDDEGAATE
ncbi:MAG: hypothetical protein PHQ36_05410 [Anaerolineales bacterium]|nr:hypothetical protein [Anaerolineales bacterium]